MYEYVDNDVSADSGKPTPEYQRLLADIESGVVYSVIVWHQDRLHRQPIELEELTPREVGQPRDQLPDGVLLARGEAPGRTQTGSPVPVATA